MGIRLILLMLWFGVFPVQAQTQEQTTAIQSLHHFIQNVQSASGQFSQRALAAQQGTDSKAGERPAQTGQFAFARPGRFRWETLAPHAQVITSDGITVSQYDPDLAQMTQRAAGASLGHSPAAILFGSDDLENVFQLTALPEQGGLQWLRATPRLSDAGFQYLDMGFADQLPARLLLVDAFDQTTRIDLHDMTLNPVLADDVFRLTVPPDVDVVRLE